MKNEVIKGSKNELPVEGLQEKEPSQKYTWLKIIVKAVSRWLSRPTKRKRTMKYERTEVNKDGYINQKLTIKDEYTSNE